MISDGRAACTEGSSMVPIAILPEALPRSSLAVLSSSSDEASSRAACSDSCNPAAVGTTPCGVRVNSGRPNCCSSERRWWLAAGWLMRRRSAARVR
ncbi:Uncharacterised protein [Bordetella pertussis]|nr:Uncharacterised protein [Bordetella pertussis]